MNASVSNQKKQPNAHRKVVVSAKDLPVHCPLPDSSLWNSHPRVYIPLQEAENSRAMCPYCGTEFVLE
jgi:uncharacterized Zn-finger protein